MRQCMTNPQNNMVSDGDVHSMFVRRKAVSSFTQYVQHQFIAQSFFGFSSIQDLRQWASIMYVGRGKVTVAPV
jgi:hypothetical protein